MLKERKGYRPLHMLADEIGCSVPLLSLVLNGQRAAGPKILKFLGLERVKTQMVYRKSNGRGAKKNGA